MCLLQCFNEKLVNWQVWKTVKLSCDLNYKVNKDTLSLRRCSDVTRWFIGLSYVILLSHCTVWKFTYSVWGGFACLWSLGFYGIYVVEVLFVCFGWLVWFFVFFGGAFWIHFFVGRKFSWLRMLKSPKISNDYFWGDWSPPNPLNK